MNILKLLQKTISRQDKMVLLLLVLFLFLISIILIRGYMYFLQGVNSDSAGNIFYFVSFWERADPFSPAFAHTTEPFFLRAWFFFLPAYIITQDLIQSTQFYYMISRLLSVISCLFLFNGMKWSLAELLLGLLTYFGLSSIGILNFICLNAFDYNFSFFLFSLVCYYQRQGIISNKVLALLTAISLYSGLCGLKFGVFALLPIFLFESILLIRAKIRKEQITYNYIKLSIIQLFANAIGILIYKLIVVPHMVFHSPFQSAQLISAGDLWTFLGRELVFVLESFGIYFYKAPIFANSSLCSLYIIALLCVLFCVGWNSWRIIISESENRQIGYSLCSLFIVLFVLTIAKIDGRPRYYLFASPIILVIIVVAVYRFLDQRKDLRKGKYIYLGFLLIGFILFSYTRYSNWNYIETPHMQVTSHLIETGCNRVVGTYWNSLPIRLLSDGKINSLTVRGPKDLRQYDWGNDRTQYINDDDSITLLVRNNEMNSWNENKQTKYLLSLANTVSNISDFHIYTYEKNPFCWDYLKFGLNVRFNFLTLSFNKNTQLVDGKIVLNKGGIQFGPYYTLEEGRYEIIIRGDNLANGKYDAVSNISKPDGKKIFALEAFEKDSSCVHYFVHVESKAERVEFRCFNQSDTKIMIRDITVNPVGKKPVWDE